MKMGISLAVCKIEWPERKLQTHYLGQNIFHRYTWCAHGQRFLIDYILVNHKLGSTN